MQLNRKVMDEEVVSEGKFGSVFFVDLGDLPAQSDLSSYHLMPNGDRLFSLDIAAQLGPSNLLVRPQDVILFDGSDYSLMFDGQSAGVPAAAKVDAVSIHSSGDVLLSFDIAVSLPGNITVYDEDLARFDGASFSLYLDGSAAGIPASLDIDAVHFIPGENESVLLSFDVSGSINGVVFDDEDLLEFDTSTQTWSLAFDASAAYPGWRFADLDAAFATFAAQLIFMDGFESP